jgi:hypothetical protein
VLLARNNAPAQRDCFRLITSSNRIGVLQRLHCRLVMVFLCADAIACVPVRGSSRDYLNEDQSQLVVGESLENAARRVHELFLDQHVPYVEERNISVDERVLVYSRGWSSTIQRDLFGDIRTDTGSVFFAHLKRRGPTQTAIYFLGKPTLNGKAICTDYDRGIYDCQHDGWAVLFSPEEKTFKGHTEADVVQKVIKAYRAELERSEKAAAGL